MSSRGADSTSMTRALMSPPECRSGEREAAARTKSDEVQLMDMKLEVVVLPVSDVDRAKSFYQALGWRLDADFAGADEFRVVQLTPPGSTCSVIFGNRVTAAVPGSAEGMQLVVSDIDAARGVARPWRRRERSVPRRGRRLPPRRRRQPFVRPGPGAQELRLVRLVRDPDGNRWYVQEITTRLPGR